MFKYVATILILFSACLCDEPKHIYNIVVLGNTGSGKSALLNMFAGKENAFKVGLSINPETKFTTSQIHNYNGTANGYTLRLIDTQGLSDGGGPDREVEHINDMIEAIKQFSDIDLFIICLDGPNPRFTSYIQSMISRFKKIFPKFLENSVLVFNKWNEPNSDRRDELMMEYQKKFLDDYNITKMPCFFIDSFYNLKMLRRNSNGTMSKSYLHETFQAESASQSDALIQYLVEKKEKADVRHLEKVKKEKDELEELKQQLSQAVKMNEQKYCELQSMHSKSGGLVGNIVHITGRIVRSFF